VACIMTTVSLPESAAVSGLEFEPKCGDAALAEGWSILETGAVGHNHYHFHAHGIEAELEAGRLRAVERHATALEQYTASQPNAWADFRIRRARALVAAASGQPSRLDLSVLEKEAMRVGLSPELTRLQAALARTDA